MSEQALPIPLSGIPWLQDKFSYRMSKLASALIVASSIQSSLWLEAIIEPTMILLGWSFFSYFAPSTQYLALFSEINSIFEKDGYFLVGSEVPLNILGATLWI